MRRIFLLLAILLLGFGCVDTRGPSAAVAERVTNTQAMDIDGDSIVDYAVYTFAPVTDSNSSMVLQRQVMVATGTSGTYTSLNPNLTDVDLLVADQSLEQFSQSVTQARTACGRQIGITNVVCADVSTCNRLCAAASSKCRKISESFDEALGGSMITYVQDTTEISSLLLDMRRLVLLQRTGSDENRAEYIGKSREIIAKIADVNTNPLYANPDLSLCTQSEFGTPFLLEAVTKVGNYTTESTGYEYTVLISAKPANATGLGAELMGVTLRDGIANTVARADEISSNQQIKTSEDALNTKIEWSSQKSSDAGYILAYGFSSQKAPEELLQSLKTPEITVKTINLALLAPIGFLFDLFYGLLSNYYLALGISMALAFAVLLILYNLIVVVFSILTERAGGMNLTTAIRRAFGSTDITWKTDIVIAALALLVGGYVSMAIAEQPSVVPEITKSLEYLLQTGAGMVGTALTIIGVLMLYFAAENVIKIAILERSYGMVIRQEKDLFLAKVATLKDKLKELETLIEKYREEDFDVGKEYDILTSISVEKIDSFAKNMTPRSKAAVDEELMHVDGAISGLQERKKVAESNWPKWKENIAKVLEAQNEIYASSLVAVPASLRQWALTRYMKENAAPSMVLEHDSIKKKRLTADQLVEEMINLELIKGGMVIRNDKIVAAGFSDGGETMKSALVLKLRNYLRSLAKNIGQAEPNSFAALGGKYIIAYMRGRGYESVVFMGKDKFKDALEQWKAKMKLLEGL